VCGLLQLCILPLRMLIVRIIWIGVFPSMNNIRMRPAPGREAASLSSRY
jgi:hypothetical protein